MEESILKFTKEILQVAFEGGVLDGNDIYDMGIKHGLVVKEEYDPEVHGDFWLGTIEPEDDIYLYSKIFWQYILR